jgi:hypothetical protein
VTLRAVRPDVHERFVAVVQRGVARADREDAARLVTKNSPGASLSA